MVFGFACNDDVKFSFKNSFIYQSGRSPKVVALFSATNCNNYIIELICKNVFIAVKRGLCLVLIRCAKIVNAVNSLRWRHNGHDRGSNHQPHHCLRNRLFRRRSKKTSKLRVTGLCVGNSPVTGEFAAKMASYAENVSIWWRHHAWYETVRYNTINVQHENDPGMGTTHSRPWLSIQ